MDKQHTNGFRESSPKMIDLIRYYGAVRIDYNRFYCFHHRDCQGTLTLRNNKICHCFDKDCEVKNWTIEDLIRFKEKVCSPLDIQNKINDITGSTGYKRVIKNRVSEHAQIKAGNKTPKLYPLQKQHLNWLETQVGAGYHYLLREFKLRTAFNHLAIPIDEACNAFIFVPFHSKSNHRFHSGADVLPPIFPHRPRAQYKASNIIVVRDEMTAMKVTYQVYLKGMSKDWAVITNTGGLSAINHKAELFDNFNKGNIRNVVIRYGKNEEARLAGEKVESLARNAFGVSTVILNMPKMWD